MEKVEQTLALLESVLEPSYFNSVQELVFRLCWQGLSYEEIAEQSGYDADYLRSVGSRLWQMLSDKVGKRMTKNNFRSILRHYLSQEGIYSEASVAQLPLEFPDGPVPLSSPFYIERPPIEQRAFETVLQPGALLRIKAPQRMGKTSLLLRIVDYAALRGIRVVRLNLQQADPQVLNSLDSFLRWFCANLAFGLRLEPNLNHYWDEDLGSKVNCTTYMQNHLLENVNSPLLIVLDEVSYIFEYPEIGREFFPLLRFWHEEANNLNHWQRLGLVITYATDCYVPLNINQSPFNIGLTLQLPEFSLEQVKTLAKQHGLEKTTLSDNALKDLMAMLGGHPYLIRIALYHLVRDHTTLSHFLQTAPTPTGLYGDHLRSYLIAIQPYPELVNVLKQVMFSENPIQIEPMLAYKLCRMGLLTFQGNKVVPGCELYRRYFCDNLHTV